MRIILLTIIYINVAIADYSTYISGFNSTLNARELRDLIVQEYVQDLNNKLLPNKDIKTSVISEENKLNAFTIFNKFVVLYPELIKKLNTEHQLCAIMAHELAHVEHNHYYTTIKEISDDKLKNMITVALSSIAAGTYSKDPNILLGSLYTSLATIKNNELKQSRIKEEQADIKAIEILKNIGGSANDLIEAFEIMKANSLTNIDQKQKMVPEEYNSTHPHLSTRIKIISKYKTKIRKKTDQLSFNLIRARLGKTDFKSKTEAQYVKALALIKSARYPQAETILINLPYKDNWIILATLIECWDQQGKVNNIINIDNNGVCKSETVKFYQTKALLKKGEYIKARKKSELNMFKITSDSEHNYIWLKLLAEISGSVTNDDYFMYFMGLYNFNKGNFIQSKLQLEKSRSSALLSTAQLKDLIHCLKVIKEFS